MGAENITEKKPDIRVGVGITLVRIQNGKTEVLLGLRKGGYQSNLWAVPAGHLLLEDNEGFRAAAIRETLEETGVQLDADQLQLISLSQFTDTQKERSYVNCDFAVELGEWKGTVELREPEKCAEWRWFPVNDLPEEQEMHHPALIAINAYNHWKRTGEITVM